MNEQDRNILRLWAYVFVQGIRDYTEARRRGFTSEGSSEVYWFESDIDEHPGSFLWLCELFDLDPTRARSAVLMNMRKINREAKRADADVVCRDQGKNTRDEREPVPARDRADTACDRRKAVPESGRDESIGDVLREAFPEGLCVPEEACC